LSKHYNKNYKQMLAMEEVIFLVVKSKELLLQEQS